MLERVAISFSRGSSQPRNRTWVSCTAGGLLHCKQIFYQLSCKRSPRRTLVFCFFFFLNGLLWNHSGPLGRRGHACQSSEVYRGPDIRSKLCIEGKGPEVVIGGGGSCEYRSSSTRLINVGSRASSIASPGAGRRCWISGFPHTCQICILTSCLGDCYVH